MNTPDKALSIYVGSVKEVILPSGNKIFIRELNGGDDDVLTSSGRASTGESLLDWISGIATKDFERSKLITPEEVGRWPLHDKYYAVLAIRVHSFGCIITFKHTCSNKACKKESLFEENLAPYIWDYSKPVPLPSDPEYFKYRAKNYPNGINPTITATLSNNMVVSFNLMTTAGEQYLLSLPEDSISRNQGLIAREFSVRQGETPLKIKDFSVFPSSIMREVVKLVEEADPTFDMITSTTCPYCGNTEEFPLLLLTDFLYPAG